MSVFSREADQPYDVIIAGAGPVGLCLAIDLGRRGVRCLLLERNATTAPWPKMDRCNARTMEMFRRIGLAERVRALGYPADNPMDVFLVTKLSEPAVEALRYPSVAQYRETIAACTEGLVPLEPYQLVSQNAVEPLLKDVEEHTRGVSVHYGMELVDFVQDEASVTVTTRTLQGESGVWRAKYLVGCDGGRSVVRKKLGIALQGQGRIRELCQAIFWSENLYERIVAGKGRHYCFASGASITAQGNRKEFTFHSALPPDSDFKAAIQDVIGFPCEFEVSQIVTWRHHLLLADRYRDERVVLAGDAAHLLIPTGGLGMNTGVGDAFDLSWKLAGMVQEWGGPALLESYQIERRRVAQRNIEASGWAAGSVGKWISQITPQIYEKSAEESVPRRRMREAFRTYHSRMYGMVGAELGYTYAWSPIVSDEPGNVPEWEISDYSPHTRPGVRLPHMWLHDGRALQDVLPNGYALIDLGGKSDTAALAAAFGKRGAPFEVVRLVDEKCVREVYGCTYLLLRPDLHIAWRGDAVPKDSVGLASLVTGNR